MERLSLNLQIGKTRREQWNGREYLVAPACLIVPGVLQGSKGSLYYPPDELAKNVKAWNGKPLTLYHPIDPATGEHVSADSPGIISRQGIGVLRNVHANGRLTGETWFDIEKTANADKRFGTDVLRRLQTNTPVELSTGLYTENTPAPKGASYNGRAYDFVARDYKPDHLAILPTQTGACSINDGCGVLVNKGTSNFNPVKEGINPLDRVLAEARKEFQRLAKEREGGITNAGINQPRCPEKGQYLSFGAGTGKGDLHQAAKVGGSHVTETDRELGRMAGQEKALLGNNPPSWAVDEDKWEKAKEAADKGGYAGDAYWAVVSHIYQNMGGEIKSEGETNMANNDSGAPAKLVGPKNKPPTDDPVDVEDDGRNMADLEEIEDINADEPADDHQKQGNTPKNLAEDAKKKGIKPTKIIGNDITNATENAWIDTVKEASDAARRAGGSHVSEEAADASNRAACKSTHFAAAESHSEAANLHARLARSTTGEESVAHGDAMTAHHKAAAEHMLTARTFSDRPPGEVSIPISDVQKSEIWDKLGKLLGVMNQEKKPFVIVNGFNPNDLTEGDAWEAMIVNGSIQWKMTGPYAERILAENADATTNQDERPRIGAFAFTPDLRKPDEWKLRIDDAKALGEAVAALEKGEVEIPKDALNKVKAKMRSAWKRYNPGKSEEDAPEILRNNNPLDAAVNRARLSWKKHFGKDAPEILKSTTANQTRTEVNMFDRDKALAVLTANCKCEDDKQVLNQLSDEALEGFVTNAKKKPKTNAEDEEDEELVEMTHEGHYFGDKGDIGKGDYSASAIDKESNTKGGGETQAGDKSAAASHKKGFKNKSTMNELLANATDEDRAIWEYATRIERQARLAKVQQLVGNVADKKTRQELAAEFMGMPLDKLDKMLALVPQPQTRGQAPQPVRPQFNAAPVPEFNFLGQAAPFAANHSSGKKEEMVEEPTINYKELSESWPKGVHKVSA